MSSLHPYGNKFVRRPDLSTSIRLYLAYTALMAMENKHWGKITQLSRIYLVSRTFVYALAATLEDASLQMFGDAVSALTTADKWLPFVWMLSLRLEGRCSVGATSTIMKRFDQPYSSTGAISQYLAYFGSLLPNTLSTKDNEVQLAIFLCDELFSKRTPILITVEPISSAILRIELADSRTAEDWKKHWQCLEENGYYAAYLVTDEGTGLCSAHQEALVDIIRQPDTYHAIAHVLGKLVKQLEDAAYKDIKEEYERYEKLDSAKSDPVIEKRIAGYEKAADKAHESIELYENFRFLYLSTIESLQIFDQNGNLRERKAAQEDIGAALGMMDELGVAKVSKAVKKVRATTAELLNYFDTARTVVESLMSLPIDPQALKVLCLAWQCHKGLIKSKKTRAKKYYAERERFNLEIASGYLQDDFEQVYAKVYMKLDKIVQSSALVECINSIIRPYLNSSKNQVTQQTLNLIMFYHNHRRYKDGERRGKTPIEILTGEKQEKNWIELLRDAVEEKDPSFLAFS